MITDEAIYAELQSSDINSEYPPRNFLPLPGRGVLLPPQAISRAASQRPCLAGISAERSGQLVARILLSPVRFISVSSS